MSSPQAQSRHYSPILLLGWLGATLMTIFWTLLRFFNRPSSFDLVGQQVMAHQLLNGGLAGAQIGTTNYMIKLLILYMPLDVVPGSPRLKLIILTILVNLLSLWLIVEGLRRLFRQLGADLKSWQAMLVLWLAAIAGSVFWISFTNSRNLEVAAGIWLLYFGLRWVDAPSRRAAALLVVFCSLLFFNDPLQAYMVAIPLLAFLLLVKRRLSQPFLGLTGIFVGGVVGAWLLKTVATHVLQITFMQQGSGTSGLLSLHFWITSVRGWARALLTIYAGAADAGRIRELLNVLLIVFAGTVLLWAILRNKIAKKIWLFVGTVFVINTAIYILSGQAAKADTSRYLIMTVPLTLFILVLAISKLPSQFRRWVAVGFGVIAAINLIALGGTLGRQWQTDFPQDEHLASIQRYTISHPGGTVYLSMDSALPSAYLYKTAPHNGLPLTCTPTKLLRSNLFFGQTAYQQGQVQNGNVRIILDGSAIKNVPNVCEVPLITQQFGAPIQHDTTDDGSVVFVYRSIKLPQ